jgi:hypothetical protein
VKNGDIKRPGMKAEWKEENIICGIGRYKQMAALPIISQLDKLKAKMNVN